MIRIPCTLMLLLSCAATTTAQLAPTLKDIEGNPLPQGATARLGSSAFRATDPRSLEFSADGSAVLARDNGKDIAWDAKTGERLAKPPANTRPAFEFEGMRFPSNLLAPDLSPKFDGPNSPILTVADKDGKALLRLDLKDVSRDWVYRPVIAAANWSRVAAVSDTDVTVYDVPTGREVARFKRDAKYGFHVRFSPDGKNLFVNERIAFLNLPKLDTRRYSLPDGKELTPLQTANHDLNLLEVSPDGSTAVGTGDSKIENGIKADDFITVYDLATGKTRGQLELRAHARSARYLNADTVAVACTHPDRLGVWNLKTLQPVWQLPVTGALALSPDGKRLALGTHGQIQFYDPTTGKRLDTPAAITGGVTHIRFSPDDKTVTTFGQSDTFAWGLDGKQLRKSTGTVREPASGVRAARIDDGVRYRGWDRNTGKEAWTFETKGPLPLRVMSHDGNRVLAVFYDRLNGWSATVYDGPTGKTVANWDFKSPDNPVPKELVLSGDGRTLFVPSKQTSVYDTETGKIRERMNTSSFYVGYDTRYGPVLSSSHDASRLAVILSVKRADGNGNEGVLVVIDMKTKRELVRYPWTIGSDAYGLLKFAPDGRTVAAWNPHESDLHLYDAEQKRDPIKLSVNEWPQCVAFSNDTKTLAVGYNNGIALLWDLTAKPK